MALHIPGILNTVGKILMEKIGHNEIQKLYNTKLIWRYSFNNKGNAVCITSAKPPDDDLQPIFYYSLFIYLIIIHCVFE